MSDIIDVSPTGEQINYDANGNAMVFRNGQWVWAPEYNRPPVYQPAPTPVYQTPAYQAPAAAQPASGGNMLAFFTGGQGTDTSTLPAYMLQADHESSMDGQDQTMVDTIRLNARGDLVMRMGGIELPAQRDVEVVILGVGPTGGRGTVYRTYFDGNYDPNAESEAKKPVCWSYDNVKPAPGATAPQGVLCESCPMNVKGSGPNNTRKCGKSMLLLVALASDLTKTFRIKVSSKGIYTSDVNTNQYGLKPYATLLKSRGANWEGMVTRLECPEGLSGGLRFYPVRFLTEQEYKLTQELKMKLDISLYINLDADQQNASVVVEGQTVANVPAAQVAQVAHNIQQAVVQAAQAPVVQPAPAVVTPTPAPVQSVRDQWQAHPAWATVPQNVRDYVLHPQVSEQDAHNYLAQSFPAVLAPVAPVAPVVAPAAPVAVPPAAPVQPASVPQPTAPQPAQPAPTTVVTPAPTTPAAPDVMPVAPAEPVAPSEPVASPQPAPAANPATGTIAAQNINDLLAQI